VGTLFVVHLIAVIICLALGRNLPGSRETAQSFDSRTRPNVFWVTTVKEKLLNDPSVGVGICSDGASGLSSRASLGSFVAKDANARGMQVRPGIGVFLFCIVFVPLYLIVRKALPAVPVASFNRAPNRAGRH